MPVFWYEAVGPGGKVESGNLTAPDEHSAFQEIHALGLTVTRLSTSARADVPWYKRDVTFGRNRLTLHRQAEIAGRLAVLFRSGIPVGEIPAILGRGSNSAADRDFFRRIAVHVADGMPLGEAFSRTAGSISPLFLSVLRLADQLPDPGDVISVLAGFLRRQDQARRRFTGALIYPAILLLGALVVLAVVALFLAPSLLPLFESVGKPAPSVLALLGGFGQTIVGNWLPLLIGMALVLVALVIFSRAYSIQKVLRHFLIRFPFVRDNELSRVTYSLAMLTVAGVPLVTAFRETAESADASLLGPVCINCAEGLEHGGTASDVLAGQRFIPSDYLELFRIGENSNRLGEILSLLATDFEQRAEQSLARLLVLLTPALTLLIGGGIALLVYSVMSAVLSVNDLAF